MLVYLTPNDFFVTRQNQLANKIRGFSLIFFSSSNCKYCKDVMPSFVRLSGELQGCTFGLMNVDQDDQRIVNISNTTLNKLDYVPYIVLYVNGIPHSVFSPDEKNPSANYESMKKFIIDTTISIKNGSFKKRETNNNNDAISPYSVGIPGNKKRVCYLNYDNAYKRV